MNIWIWVVIIIVAAVGIYLWKQLQEAQASIESIDQDGELLVNLVRIRINHGEYREALKMIRDAQARGVDDPDGTLANLSAELQAKIADRDSGVVQP